jgi:hypothetical protein
MVDRNAVELANKEDAVTDVDATTDINLQGENPSIDPDDNAGDADASGDGSAFVCERFIEYNGDEEDCEAGMTPISQKSEAVIQDIDKLSWKDYVWGLHFIPACLSDLFPIQDDIRCDAMHVVNSFEYKCITQNPFNEPIHQKKPQVAGRSLRQSQG